MALRRKAAETVVQLDVSAAATSEQALEQSKVQQEQVVSDARAAHSRYELRLDVTKSSISAAAAISNNPSQIAHIAVQIADAVIAELAKEK